MTKIEGGLEENQQEHGAVSNSTESTCQTNNLAQIENNLYSANSYHTRVFHFLGKTDKIAIFGCSTFEVIIFKKVHERFRSFGRKKVPPTIFFFGWDFQR